MEFGYYLVGCRKKINGIFYVKNATLFPTFNRTTGKKRTSNATWLRYDKVTLWQKQVWYKPDEVKQ